MRLSVTRDDVAQRAGVSTATVSNVFNGKFEFVSQDTARRVLQIAEEMNYRPNMVARSLAKAETMQLSLLINDIHNQFFIDIIHFFETAALQKGYMVSVCTGNGEFDRYIKNFIDRHIDGLFLMISPTRADMNRVYELIEHDIKVVVSGNLTVDNTRVCSVEPDCFDGMDKAIAYLKSKGHHKIAYLSAFKENFVYDNRLAAFKKAYENHFSADEKIIITGKYPFDSDEQTGYSMAMELLRSDNSYTAVLATNDLMAMGCIKAFQREGLRVPDDVSVMGIDDDTPLVEYITPKLTTMSVDKQKLAQVAFSMLYDTIKGEKPRREYLDYHIVERESVK